MEAKAISKGLQISPTKLRQVLSLIRGKKAGEALAILKFTPKKAARCVEKALQSALANADNNYGLDVDKLVVSEAFADRGTAMKRFRPVSMGRAHPFKRTSSHLTIVVSER